MARDLNAPNIKLGCGVRGMALVGSMRLQLVLVSARPVVQHFCDQPLRTRVYRVRYRRFVSGGNGSLFVYAKKARVGEAQSAWQHAEALSWSVDVGVWE